MSITSPRILLIEDDANIRRFVRLAMEDEGWQVFDADTAQDWAID